jgi:hypothetical protein
MIASEVVKNIASKDIGIKALIDFPLIFAGIWGLQNFLIQKFWYMFGIGTSVSIIFLLIPDLSFTGIEVWAGFVGLYAVACFTGEIAARWIWNLKGKLFKYENSGIVKTIIIEMLALALLSIGYLFFQYESWALGVYAALVVILMFIVSFAIRNSNIYLWFNDKLANTHEKREFNLSKFFWGNYAFHFIVVYIIIFLSQLWYLIPKIRMSIYGPLITQVIAVGSALVWIIIFGGITLAFRETDLWNKKDKIKAILKEKSKNNV